MSNEVKNYQIKKTLAATKSRRKNLDVRVFEVKVDESHVSELKMGKLESAFREAKWIYNELLSDDAIFEERETIKTVTVKAFNPETGKCDVDDERTLTLGSQIKQSVIQRARQNVVNLAKAKAKGLKVGKLKFKKEVNCIPLKQFGTTYRLNGNSVFVQGIGKLRVNGLEQVEGAFEISCANLIRKASGFYVKITCYFQPEVRSLSGEIGMDMGIHDTVTLSDGQKFSLEVPMPEVIKRNQQKLSRKKRGSQNSVKCRKKLKRKYERWGNRKDDMANKFVHSLKGYSKVVYQDENLAGWQKKWFGKTISESTLGRIKAKLKKLPTSVMIDRYLPTTKICINCGKLNDIPLNQRIYPCRCGFVDDRDIKSAKAILLYGQNKIPVERGNPPVESATAATPVWGCKSLPVKQEAPML